MHTLTRESSGVQRMHEDLMTPAEVAVMKGVQVVTVYQAIHRGQLPATKLLNRHAVRRGDAEAWQPTSWGGKRTGQGRPPKHDGE